MNEHEGGAALRLSLPVAMGENPRAGFNFEQTLCRRGQAAEESRPARGNQRHQMGIAQQGMGLKGSHKKTLFDLHPRCNRREPDAAARLTSRARAPKMKMSYMNVRGFIGPAARPAEFGWAAAFSGALFPGKKVKR